MAGTYNYDPSKKLFHSKITGILTTEEIKSHVLKLFGPNVNPKGLVDIVNMNEAEDLVVRYSEMIEIRGLSQELKTKGFRGVILYASTPRGNDLLTLMVPCFQLMKPTTYVCNTEMEALNYYEALQCYEGAGTE